MTAELFRLLSLYNIWANHKVLEQAALVPEADYFAPTAGLSFSNLHATLVHALIAEIIWQARWQGGLPPDGLKPAATLEIAASQIATFDALREIWEIEEGKQREFFSRLTDADLSRPLAYKTQNGERNVQPLDQLVAHFINHGTQFRTEAGVRLTQLGHSPGDLDLIIFLRDHHSA